jgi:hypothetical protein
VIELQPGGACYSWSLPPSRRLGGGVSIEARKKLVHGSEQGIVRGILLTSREMRRAKIVERGVKSSMGSSRIKC